MKFQPMSIRSSITRNAHANGGNVIDRALDAGLVVCAISALIALLLFLDAYEYIVVPGASTTRSQKQVSIPAAPVTTPVAAPTTSASIPLPVSASVPASVPASAPAPASAPSAKAKANGIAQTKDSLQQEIEKAQRLIEQKRQELESLSTAQVETLAESEGVDDTALKEANTSSNVQEEKEEVIEEIVEKELGIDEFCPTCIWLETSVHTCEARLKWLKRHYKSEEDAGKKVLLDQGCRKKSKDGVRRRLRR